ncbi:MAG: dihydroorotate dehydrogenase [Candidatus Edwardsbacteria bacterium]|nr:dihydroorotate dehydrogenase [Candidatus Edwardsbacteria bacterium]
MKKLRDIDLRVSLAGLELKNPVIAASGTFGYGTEYSTLAEPGDFGAVITKTITLSPRAGNPPPRVCETACGMLNSIGLANVGFEAFKKDKLPRLLGKGTVIIANIAGNTIEEYVELAGKLNKITDIPALELNISCPNVRHGGIAFGTDPAGAAALSKAVRRVYKKTLIVKLSPNVSDIAAIARAVEKAGADALSLINTLYGMAVDIRKRRPVLGNITGGLSGPAIKPVALYNLYKAYHTVKIPLIGLGGIMNYTDALEFMITGAAAVQIGTANFVNPSAARDILAGMTGFCRENNIIRVKNLTGVLKC